MKNKRELDIETALELVIFHSRWALIPFFLGLIVALIGYLGHFLLQIQDLFTGLKDYNSNEMLVLILTLVDKVLVSSLIVMVIIGTYENTVSKLNISPNDRKVSWLGKLDASSLKLKLATSIVSISSVHMLRQFMDINNILAQSGSIGGEKLKWSLMIYFAVIFAAVALAGLDWIVTSSKNKN